MLKVMYKISFIFFLVGILVVVNGVVDEVDGKIIFKLIVV